MSETFTRIAAGHYRNAETGIEIVKVSSDEAGWGRGGWHVTVPVRGGSFTSSAINPTKRYAEEDAEGYVQAMRETIAADFEEATAVIHHVTRYSREISCGATGPVRVEETAMLVTCPECVAADDEGRMAEAERQAYAEDAERFPRCTAKVNSMYPHLFEHDADVAADPEITPGYDTCGRDVAGHADYTRERIIDVTWFQAVYDRAVDNTRGHLGDGAIVQAWRELLAEAHAEALYEDGERYAAGCIAGQVEWTSTDEALHAMGEASKRKRQINNWYARHGGYRPGMVGVDHDEALHEQAKRDAVQVIAASRAPEDVSGVGLMDVPADLDDDEAWATYCAALPEPTDREIADVLAEYGDPYAASRAEVVETYKNSARSIWKIRADGQDDELTRGLIRCLRSSMRTLRGVIEIYDACSESWRMEVRTGSARDSFTKTFDGPATVSMPGMAARTVVAGDTLRISVQPPTFS